MAACLLLANFLSKKYGSVDSKTCSRGAGSADRAGSEEQRII
jgi:hypothetical protein